MINKIKTYGNTKPESINIPFSIEELNKNTQFNDMISQFPEFSKFLDAPQRGQKGLWGSERPLASRRY